MSYVILSVVGSIALGYLMGSINLSYIISKSKGFDIRKYGSGNAGASNVIIVIGKKAGAIVAFFDIFKAFFAVIFAGMIFKGAVISDFNYASVLAGAASILGHIAPFYMGFKGGKGFAALGGAFFALDFRLTVTLLIVSLIIAFVTDYICFVPILMVAIGPILYSIIHASYIPVVIFIPIMILVWYRHYENIQRIKAGKELKFHFLWNRQSESERFGITDDNKSVFDGEVDDKYHMNSAIK